METTLRNGTSYWHKGDAQQTVPLPQTPETEHRVAYTKGYAKEGDSVTVPSLNTGMTSILRVSKGTNSK